MPRLFGFASPRLTGSGCDCCGASATVDAVEFALSLPGNRTSSNETSLLFFWEGPSSTILTPSVCVRGSGVGMSMRGKLNFGKRSGEFVMNLGFLGGRAIREEPSANYDVTRTEKCADCNILSYSRLLILRRVYFNIATREILSPIEQKMLGRGPDDECLDWRQRIISILQHRRKTHLSLAAFGPCGGLAIKPIERP